MPNSLLEAMASGVPIVSTSVGGIPFLVEDGRTALLVPPGQPPAMAEAVLRLLREPELADRLRSEARREVSRYAWPRVRPVLFGAYMRAAGMEAAA
jgi:glycosyltransferase involved in cell wall biosynthesis